MPTGLSSAMRIGIVSDIHCNAAGLAAALERMGAVDALLCAGDIMLEYRFGNEVAELLRSRGAHCIRGNHDDVLLGYHGERARAAPHVDPDHLAWLAGLPARLELEFAGRRILMVHGSPYAPHYEYLYPGTPRLAQLGTLDCDVLVLGHTHMQMATRIGRPLVINPGSAGDGRDHRNARQLSYALLDLESGEAQIENYADPRLGA